MLVAPGLSTTLPCLVENKVRKREEEQEASYMHSYYYASSQVGECRWSKGGKPVGMFGGKYEMRGDTEQGDCSLTLHSLDLRIDDGQWQCQVSMGRSDKYFCLDLHFLCVGDSQ